MTKPTRPKPTSYGEAVANLPLYDANRKYHDTQYGFPIKQTFKLTSGEITGEFLMSTGYLPDAHESCSIYKILSKIHKK